MFFTAENQTLYPAVWEYNATLIINELANIVENNGGRVKRGRIGYIVNRSILSVIREAEERKARIIEAMKKGIGNKEKQNETIKKLEKDIKELEAIPNEPQKVNLTTYISFIIKDTYYYIEIADNPFFEHTYCKTPIVNGKRSKDAIHEQIKSDILWDCFVTVSGKRATKEDIREAANIIFNEVAVADMCEKWIDSQRVRVSNTYNNGYHYEKINKPERMETIDF